MSAIHLTPNFTLGELIESDNAERAGIDNTPNSPIVMANLHKLALLLEEVRKACGNNAVLVSSGYRSPKLNELVGGSATSDHMTGEAADFRIPRFGNPLQVARRIVELKIKFGQLIFEGTWIHISLPDGGPRDGQVLTAKFVRQPNGKMKVTYLKGLPV
jgi:zinc D-Ala-D-Ala carboxypeptidase